nr:alpha/beta fold hydrolase [Saprospiraceae bacterium]
MENKINFKEFGTGEPVVILHGLLGMLDNWQTFARKLSENYRVYTIDLRNHGRSFHSPEMSYALMAEDLNSFLIAREVNRTHLLGHSMGGKVAMQFALKYPEKVDKLLVADIAPHSYPGGHEAIIEALLSAKPREAEERADIENHLLKFIPSRKIVLFLMKNLSRSKQGGFQWKANIPYIAKNYKHILAGIESDKKFRGNTLFLKGENSDYITEKSETSIKNYFPQSKIVEIPKAGHWIHAEAQEATLEATRNFLRKK